MSPQMWIDLSLYIATGLFWLLFLAGAVAGFLSVMQMMADIRRCESIERFHEELEILNKARAEVEGEVKNAKT